MTANPFKWERERCKSCGAISGSVDAKINCGGKRGVVTQTRLAFRRPKGEGWQRAWGGHR